ncbi:uncharacterized protein TOL2_C16780 [Desulfobacula toluolica Tol2]|uniref:Uncharacterized protein n=1 Tax=Desulfobacula toluolica (strain DSM 7467 / Tol2) TaxID=651182 RepID=K0N7A0_DESTT|nr:uncharacterized protein TOL2_C16780 [Desulfobacula toluolica Tol2]
MFDYKIWGNFPEAETQYNLEVSGKAIADIPQSIVSQMDVGDKLYLAGRLLRILNIDIGEQKKVLARPSMGKEEKQLAWIGLGPPVSYEVARTMGHILNAGESKSKIKDENCLFSRTRKLLQQEWERGEKKWFWKTALRLCPGKKLFFGIALFWGRLPTWFWSGVSGRRLQMMRYL